MLESLTGFYQLWIQLETHYIGSRFPGGKIPCQVQEGRYCRQFFLPRGEIGSEELARAITDYIRMFDHLLKVYFNHLDDCQARPQWNKNTGPIFPGKEPFYRISLSLREELR